MLIQLPCFLLQLFACMVAASPCHAAMSTGSSCMECDIVASRNSCLPWYALSCFQAVSSELANNRNVEAPGSSY